MKEELFTGDGGNNESLSLIARSAFDKLFRRDASAFPIHIKKSSSRKHQ